MLLSKARTALQAGRTIVGHWHGSGNPLLAETVTATSDFDVIVIDLQHGILDAAAAMSCMASVRNATPFIRLRDNTASHIHHCLDAGALGLIAPLINTADEARALVRESTYPPRGVRSFGPIRASLLSPRYFSKADDVIMRWAMIETTAGLDHAAEIAQVDGIDGLFIGPNDLALALGVPPSSTPTNAAVIAAIERIRSAAHAAKKSAGIFCGDGASARAMLDRGFDFVTCGTDTGLLAAAAARELAIARKSVGGEGGRPAAVQKSASV